MEIVKNETQLIRQKREVFTCPTSGPWIKNIYDECYQYVTEPKDYADAVTHCLNLDSNAHLPILVEGTRFIRLYSNIKENMYPGYDITSAQQYFWLDAKRTGTTDQGFAIFKYIDESMVDNLIYFIDETNKPGFDTGLCAVAMLIDGDEYKFRLGAKECSGVWKTPFFCVIGGVTITTTTTTTTNPAPAAPIPVLPKFPCYGSEPSKRKKRESTEAQGTAESGKILTKSFSHTRALSLKKQTAPYLSYTWFAPIMHCYEIC
jgi:hypothetical protein